MRGSGARSPVRLQSRRDIQLCGELLSAHQCLVECFVYNLIQQHIGSVKSCSVLGSEGLLTDAKVFHHKVS